jgi:hypothetical protein
MTRNARVSAFGLVSLAALILAPACASMRPAAQNGGPALSREGVQLAILKQSCTQTQEPEQPDNDLAEATVEVEVRNPTPDALTISRTAFRLLTPDGFALKTRAWGSADLLVLKGGETRAFEMRFMSRGSLACGRELKLDPGAGVSLGGKSVKMNAVSFVPSTQASSSMSRSSAAPPDRLACAS